MKKTAKILALAMAICSVPLVGCGDGKPCEHAWEIVSSRDSTCLEYGAINYECTLCGRKRAERIDKKEHAFSDEWSSDSKNHWHSATCGCGAKKDVAIHDDAEQKFKVVLGDEWIGYEKVRYKCGVCGSEYYVIENAETHEKIELPEVPIGV